MSDLNDLIDSMPAGSLFRMYCHKSGRNFIIVSGPLESHLLGTTTAAFTSDDGLDRVLARAQSNQQATSMVQLKTVRDYRDRERNLLGLCPPGSLYSI